MASPAILDFESLLAAIPGPNPAGVSLSPEVRRVLDEKRKDKDPKKYAANDPCRPEKYQPPDWAGIVEVAQESLARNSKDLLLAARLTDALVKQHGFAGVRDGLRLLRRLVSECWDRVHPIIEDGDVETRATAFNWLDDELKAARFPYTLRTIPLTRGGDGQGFGYQHWKDAQQDQGPVSRQAFDQAFTATPREHCQTVMDDITESMGELTELTKVLSQKMGEAAPGLAQVRQALADCQELSKILLQRKGPAPVATPTPAQEVPAPANGSIAPAAPAAPAAPQAVAARPLTRDDLLNRLADASAQLLQMEPHSPIAYLVQRAVKLARLPLPELMRVLVRDQNVLGQLDRDLDLGLDKGEAAKQEAAKKK
jgi:type VI secretion system protein ImpA